MTSTNPQELHPENSGFYAKIDSRVGITHSLSRTLAGSSYSARSAIEKDVISILSPIQLKGHNKIR